MIGIKKKKELGYGIPDLEQLNGICIFMKIY